MVTKQRIIELTPTLVLGAFIAIWVGWEILVASKNPIPGWDGMVYWINGHAYLQSAPLYQYSQPPAFSLFLTVLQGFGLTINYAFIIQPVLTGLSGLLLYLLLRSYTRNWFAVLGSI